MAWPPPIPPNNRTDATDMVSAHAADHNKIADYLTKLTQAAGYTALPAPFRTAGGAINVGTGTNAGNVGAYSRIANRVFVECWLGMGASPSVPAGTLLFTLPYPISATAYPTPGTGAMAWPRVGIFQTHSWNGSAFVDGWSILDLADPGLSRFIFIQGSTNGVGVLTNANIAQNGAGIQGQFSYITDAAP